MNRFPLHFIRRICFLPALLALCLASLASAENLTVLTDSPEGVKPGDQLEVYLKNQFYEQVDQRLEAFEKIKSLADAGKWAQERYDFFLRQIGGLPD